MTEPKPLTPEEEAVRLAAQAWYQQTHGDTASRQWIDDVFTERARPDAGLLKALTEELYGLASPDIDEPGEVMVRIEEAVAAINSRWGIERARPDAGLRKCEHGRLPCRFGDSSITPRGVLPEDWCSTHLSTVAALAAPTEPTD